MKTEKEIKERLAKVLLDYELTPDKFDFIIDNARIKRDILLWVLK